MKKTRGLHINRLILCMLVLLGAMIYADRVQAATQKEGVYEYEVLSDGTVEIRKCTASGTITFPSELGGKTVTSIGGDTTNCSGEGVCNPVVEGNNFSTVIIPDTVTTIRNFAFERENELQKVVLSKNLKTIGEYAFWECKNLSDITIPEGVTSIGKWAFAGTSVKEVVIPSGVSDINEGTFMYCQQLNKVTILEGVKTISEGAFGNCPNLKEITIPASVTSISDNILYSEYGTIIRTEPGSYAEKWVKQQKINANKNGFKDPQTKSNLKVVSNDVDAPTAAYTGTTDKTQKKITIPDAVTVDGITYKVVSIGNNAFSGNKKVKTVTCGKNITSIGKNAFKNCTALTSVTVNSKELKTIGANAFSGDKKLTNITLKTTKLTKKSIGKNALKGTNKKLVVKVPKSKVKAYKTYFSGKGNKTVKVKK